MGLSDLLMAISCSCPHCGASYRLKDDLAGKKVTCKEAACRKGFDVPFPKPEPILKAKAVDIDALAAATFSDEPQKEAKVETMVDVSCAGCDHVWKVESSKAGKNVLCPECGRPNRVPLPKVEAKADWRNANDGKPTLARRDTAPKVEGAWDARDVQSITMQTAQEIVRDQDAQEEPGVARKRWIKRISYGLVASIGLGFLGMTLYKNRKVGKEEANIADALKELKNPENGFKDPRFHAIVLRASGEYKARAGTNRAEIDAALNDFKEARNAFKSTESTTDQIMILADIVRSMTVLLGNEEEAEKGKKIGKEALLKEIRQTMDRMTFGEPEPVYDLLRVVTREFHKHKEGPLAAKLAVQKYTADTIEGQEAIGIIGIELHRLGDVAGAEEVLKHTKKTEATSIQVLRLLLKKPATEAPPAPPVFGKGPAGKDPIAPSMTKFTEIFRLALAGDLAKARSMLGTGSPSDRVRGMVTCAEYGIPVDPNASVPLEVTQLLDSASQLMSAAESKNVISGWWTIRACRLYARAGKFDKVFPLADQSPNDLYKAWAKVEGLRVRMTIEKDAKFDEASAEAVGDATKSAAAAKARELVARQNAGIDNNFQKAVDLWPKGTVRPFGIAGSMLGRQDRTLR